jgi:phage protein D
MGKDLSLLMDLEVKDLDHPGLGDREIAQTILDKYARFGITAQVAAPASTWSVNEQERLSKQVATDRDYLQMLARRHSFIFCLEPGPTPARSRAYWGPPDYGSPAPRTLTVNAGTATNVNTFHISDDALAPVQVFGKVLNGGAPQPVALSVEKSSRPIALAKQSRLTDNPSFVRKQRLVYSGPNVNEAQALAQAIADRSSESTVRVTGTLDTFTYGDLLFAPGKVDVRGTGLSYDGDYFVRRVAHVINSTDYTQEFVLTREGPGSTTDKVKP